MVGAHDSHTGSCAWLRLQQALPTGSSCRTGDAIHLGHSSIGFATVTPFSLVKKVFFLIISIYFKKIISFEN